MYISTLSLKNFRNFKSSKLLFKKGINTLIGENGSGKTNVFYALRLLLDETLPRNTNLYESDFNRALGSWQGHWIIVSVRFEELDNNDECQALSVHGLGDAEENHGTYTLLFRPKISVRQQLHDYAQQADKSSAGFTALLKEITIADYKSTFLGKGSADVLDDEIYKTIVGDFETIEFPDPAAEDTSLFGQIVSRDISIPSEVSCTFVQALRDVETELKSYRRSPLLNLLRNSDGNTEAAEKQQIVNQVKTLNSQIGALEEIKTLSASIGTSIQGTIGYTYAPNVDIKSEIPDDVNRLFQSLKLWVGDPDEDNHLGKLGEISLGGANMIYLSLKLLEYEKLQSENRAAHFLLIEEPEAHIHTHIQKTLFKNVTLDETQVIVSTHSTHISSTSQAHAVNILSRNQNHAQVFHPTQGLDPRQVTGIERYLDSVRSTLLFAKGVIMVEGDAEEILLPVLIEKVLGVSLDELGISLVNIGSTGFENLAVLFHDDRIKRHCAIVTDLDEIAVAQADVTGIAWSKHVGSREAGQLRKVKFDALFDQNEWVGMFYAPHTFEVDFLQAGNTEPIKATLSDIYEKEGGAVVKKSEEKLDSDTDTTANLEVLRLANKEGKGWFAVLLSKYVSSVSIIPDYILGSIAFAAPPIPIKMQVSMISYRLTSMKTAEIQLAADFEKKHATDLITARVDFLPYYIQDFNASFPEDPLTKFFKLL